MNQYVENASHFQISSYPTSFVKEVRIKKTFRGSLIAPHPRKLAPSASRRKNLPQNRERFIKRNGIVTSFALFLLRQLLEMRYRLRRCTYTSQNPAIAPQTMYALQTYTVLKALGLRHGCPQNYIYHCRGDHWSSENERFPPYATAITSRTNPL